MTSHAISRMTFSEICATTRCAIWETMSTGTATPALALALAACGAEATAGAWTADEVLLYRSRLHPKGAVHEVVARFPLAGCGPREP